jgi:elongation factor P--beta-lysine ligase
VEGLRDLHRAFRRADKELIKELRTSLRKVAEPVRVDAEHLALTEIRKMTLPWSVMRVGVTQREVYVAPKLRGVKTRGRDPRRRPNLFDLLLTRVLEPALAHNQERVVYEVEKMLGSVAQKWERG